MIADYHELRTTTYDDDGCRWWKKNEEVVVVRRWMRGSRGGMKAVAARFLGGQDLPVEKNEGTSSKYNDFKFGGKSKKWGAGIGGILFWRAATTKKSHCHIHRPKRCLEHHDHERRFLP